MTLDASSSPSDDLIVEPSTRASPTPNTPVGMPYEARRYVRFTIISYVLLLSVMVGFIAYGLISIASMPSGSGLSVPGSLFMVLAICIITVFVVSVGLLARSIIFLANDKAAGGPKIIAVISAFIMSVLVLGGVGYIIQLFSY